eukprot:5713107-Amphidinium_carterae.1
MLDESFHYDLGLERDLENMTIVWIDEPGKLRPLTKGPTPLHLVCVVWTELVRAPLTDSPEWAYGLVSAHHGWRHSKMLQPNSPAAAHLYDDNGVFKWDEVNHLFSDLEEATDHIEKWLSTLIIRAHNRYHGVPEFFGRLVGIIAELPMNCKEKYSSSLEGVGRSASVFKFIHGSPMGTVTTKLVLTSIHILADGLVNKMFKSSVNIVPKNFDFVKLKTLARGLFQSKVADHTLDDLYSTAQR